MLPVFEVARHVFWNDAFFDRKLLPSEASLEKCTYTLTDLATMTGQERITVFKQCGIHPSLFPLFLRALQHITALHGSGSIEDNYLIHRHLSAHQWSPFSFVSPLLGYPSVVSQPYRDPVQREEVSATQAPERSVIATPNGPEMRYNGLLNQGATCYLNSLLQSLFHISAFRSTIYQMPTREEAVEIAQVDFGNQPTKSIPYALQRLFCLLQTGSKAVGTTELTASFGWSAADSFIQHDVHELTRVLLDNLEKKLSAQNPSAGEESGKPHENAIHKLFNGTLESFVRVDEVGYYGAREEPFYDLQLVVKNTKDIYASLDTFFQVEVLDGKNKYCLERNGEKSYHRAEKGVRLKETPPVMLLHLTRFDYDMQRGETKILTRWEYYSTLNLSRYMPHARPEETHYTLCSVLVHSGSNTGFGHYFCFLLCSGAWYKFNDESVSPASLKEVFGANFGGFRINYWGSEVPHTTNAYMLVYIRTSDMVNLLRPIGPEDVPRHVVEQLEKEQLELARIMKEREEDYLYGRVHFIQPQDVVEQEDLLTTRRPANPKFPSHRTLRVLLEAEALPAFQEFAERQMGLPSTSQLLWYAATRQGADRQRLYAQVKPGEKVSTILDGDSECCVLITTPENAPLISLDECDDASEYEIYHHKLYDPLRLKVLVLGSTVVRRNPAGPPEKTLAQMEPVIRHMIAQLPDETKKLYGHHLLTQSDRRYSVSVSAAEHLKMASSEAAPQKDDPNRAASPAPPRCGTPTASLHVVREDEYHCFLPCDSLNSGDILVWQLEASAEDQESLFYPDVENFQHFLRRKIPVTIKLNRPPAYPVLITTELADDMTYEQLQRYVARLIGDTANYDRVRFTRHNPETELPYFMKGKKKDRPTLTKLLTPATNRITTLSSCLYYEYCKFTVTEIENAHSLQFKLFNECVKPVSSHWILMPREFPINAPELFCTCTREIQKDMAAKAAERVLDLWSPSSKELNGVSEGEEKSTTDGFTNFLTHLAPEDAWMELRLVDVWRGRIYNVLDHDHSLVFEHQTFEESAEYRIERIPRPVSGISLEDQSLIQVHHFSLIRQRKDSVETHSEPFSIYINHSELPSELLRRIAEKLEMPYAAVQDWKVCLVKESRVVETKADTPMGTQLRGFCDIECYQPNQREPVKAAFLGLEHAPTSKRHAKREEKVVIIN